VRRSDSLDLGALPLLYAKALPVPRVWGARDVPSGKHVWVRRLPSGVGQDPVADLDPSLFAGYSSEAQQREHALLVKYGVQQQAFSTIIAHRQACRKFGMKGRWPDIGRVHVANVGL